MVYIGKNYALNLNILNWSDSSGNQLPNYPITLPDSLNNNNRYLNAYLADLNGDGINEVITDSFLVYNRDGSSYTGWDSTVASSPFQQYYPSFNNSTIQKTSIGDLDNDGTKEIVSIGIPQDGSADETILVFNHDGSLRWSKRLAKQPTSPIYLVDMTGDGKLELVFSYNNNQIYILDANGELLSGFPKEITPENSEGISLEGEFGFGDVTGDGITDLVFVVSHIVGPNSTNRYRSINVWSVSHGSFVKRIKSNDAYLGKVPLVANLDGDPESEILIYENHQVWSGGYEYISILLGFNYDGTLVSGFPKFVNFANTTQVPMVGDIDGDGKQEMVVSSEEQDVLQIFDIEACSPANQGWNQEYGGSQRLLTYEPASQVPDCALQSESFRPLQGSLADYRSYLTFNQEYGELH